MLPLDLLASDMDLYHIHLAVFLLMINFSDIWCLICNQLYIIFGAWFNGFIYLKSWHIKVYSTSDVF